MQLRMGIALTPAQIGALTQGIVWLVEQVVDGHRVLVPTLYVASVTANQLPAGVRTIYNFSYSRESCHKLLLKQVW